MNIREELLNALNQEEEDDLEIGVRWFRETLHKKFPGSEAVILVQTFRGDPADHRSFSSLPAGELKNFLGKICEAIDDGDYSEVSD